MRGGRISRRNRYDHAAFNQFFDELIDAAFAVRRVRVAAERDVQNADVVFFAVIQNPPQTAFDIVFADIFSTLMGAEFEAYGRIGSGIVELVAVILLLVPGTAWLGALLALGTISGAIFSHLTKLGIIVKDDGGLLFGLAITVFVLSAIALLIHRRDLPVLGQAFEV